MKICVVGAGPAGSFSAYLLAKSGHDVLLLEEHAEIGKPVQCSGLVTQTIRKVDEIFSSPEFEKLVVNKIRHVRLFSKHNSVELAFSEGNADCVIDRAAFDKWLAAKSMEAGAKISLQTKFLDFVHEDKDKQITIYLEKEGRRGKVRADILIGADGHFSSVAKAAGFSPLVALPCIQADIEVAMPSDTMDIYFDSRFPELFAWLVPKNSHVSEVGIGAEKDVGKKFNDFLDERRIEKKFLRHTGGPITLYNPKETRYTNCVYIIGDAAGYVKATTLGGIIPSLRAAKALANSIINGSNGSNGSNGLSFEKEILDLRRELNMHHRIHKIMNKFSDKDFDNLLEILKKEKVKKILEEESRDELSSSALKLLVASPAFLRFLGKIF